MKNITFSKQKLEKALNKIREYSKSEKFKKDKQEREQRILLFQDLYHQKFNELVFSEIVKNLWASRIWGNKEYLVDKIIKDNGIEKIRKELPNLLSSSKNPGQRYEHFLNNIKSMGPSMVTEMMCYAEPSDCGIWNTIARKSLAWLEVKNINYDKYKISAPEYNDFNLALKEIALILKKEKYLNVDLLFVDYFLWEIYNNFAQSEKIKKEPLIKKVKNQSRHDELRDKIDQIGSWLGFESETEKLIARGAKIDVIWKAKIANLGSVQYAFEVQDRGSIDSLIVNLQKTQTTPTVQKLIIVSDFEQIQKIQKEIETMPESFRKAVVFWNTTEVDNTFDHLEKVINSISNLNLVIE